MEKFKTINNSYCNSIVYHLSQMTHSKVHLRFVVNMLFNAEKYLTTSAWNKMLKIAFLYGFPTERDYAFKTFGFRYGNDFLIRYAVVFDFVQKQGYKIKNAQAILDCAKRCKERRCL